MKAAGWVLSQPWAITEEVLGTILAIAERGNESPEAVESKLGRPLDNSHEVTVRDGVAIVPVVGPISRRADMFTRISGATSIENLARDFRTAMDDRSVRAIVLEVDSPGGTVAGVGEFAAQVLAARGAKPIVAYVGSQAQSAGYWIASAADRVVADNTAMLGSIGVVMGMRLETGAKKTVEFVSSQSPHKRVDPETEAGKAQIQATVDDLADVFVDAVAAHRGVSRDAVLSDFGRGGSFVGAKAVAAGMADSIGSLESVIACLSRGEMPCPPSPPRPARKAGKTHKEPAMSEQQTPPVAGDPIAAENADLRKRLADADARALASERLTADAVRKGIQIEAQAFATDIISGQCKAVPTEQAAIVAAMTLALQADHAHPVAGSPNAHADAIKAIYAARTKHTLTVEKTASNPAQEGTALASDPAAGQKTAAEADLERLEASTRAFGKRMNGHN